MARVKDMLIEMEEHVWYCFDHGYDLDDTIAYVQEQMGVISVEDVEEMFNDLMDEF